MTKATFVPQPFIPNTPNMKTTKTILLVDDDQETFIQALREIKQVSLFNVFNNAKEAIEMLHDAQQLPDLIFMDITSRL